MNTRSTGAISKQPNSGKKKIRRNLTDQMASNFGGHSPPPPLTVPSRSDSITTLSSQSIPATQPLQGFPLRDGIRTHADVHNEDVLEMEMPPNELNELIHENVVADTESNAQQNSSNQNSAPNAEQMQLESRPAVQSDANALSIDQSNHLAASIEAVGKPIIRESQPMTTNKSIIDATHRSVDSHHPNNDTNNRSSRPIATNNLRNIPNNGVRHHSTTRNGANDSNGVNANIASNIQPNPFALRHGPNYHGNSNRTEFHESSFGNGNQSNVCASSSSRESGRINSTVAPSKQNPPMENRSSGLNRTVFSANADLQMPSQPFYTPPLGMMQVNAHYDGDANRINRTIMDIRAVYLDRLREINSRLQTEGILEAELKTMLDRSIELAARITKFVEEKEDSGRLPESELLSNQVMWQEATVLADRIKTDINTKLIYYQAGTQPNASDQRRIQHVRRLQAKIEPFGGNLDHWPNFKSKWQEFYHNCKDMCDLELFMKLDEFIIPNSEAYGLIASFDRAISGTYNDAWTELCSRYDNPRLQVDGIITKITCMDAIKDRRDHYLRAYTAINTFVHSLPRMNVDVSTWGPIIVHLVEHKMHDSVMAKWKVARSAREIARLQPLIDFFIKEIDHGDTSTRGNDRDHSRERHRGQQQHSNDQQHNRAPSNQGNHRNNQAHGAQRQPQAGSSQPAANNRQRQNGNAGATGGAPQRPKSAIQKVFKCAICNSEQHRTYVCPTFLKLDLPERVRKIRERRLCENCIRPNCDAARCTLRACTNGGCDLKHNRLICPLTFAPTVNSAQEQPQA